MYKVALGYDLHRTMETPNGVLLCGGCPIESGLVIDGAHSDGDVLYHALTDALLSVVGTDIGIVFPNTDPQFKGQNSQFFLDYAFDLVKDKYTIQNVDAVIICDRPKIASYAPIIKKNISESLLVTVDDVSVRGKTTENTRLNTIEAYVNVLFKKINQ